MHDQDSITRFSDIIDKFSQGLVQDSLEQRKQPHNGRRPVEKNTDEVFVATMHINSCV